MTEFPGWIKKTENFASITRTTLFKDGDKHRLPSGIIVELMPADPKDKYKELRKPSGFMEASGKNPGDADQKKLFGKMELVVGDACHLKLTLPEDTPFLGLVYYQLLDYTKDDAHVTRIEGKDLTWKDQAFEIRFFPDKSSHYTSPAFDKVCTPVYDRFISANSYVLLDNKPIGSLHIGQINWYTLP